MSFLTSAVSTVAHALPGTRANRLLILIYHRVHPQPDPLFPNEVDAGRFDVQMSLLRQHCSPLPLVEAVSAMRDGRLPQRAVTVTFDDGYADNATIALPILRAHGVHATFFVATGFLDGGLMWNDMVIESLRHARGGILDLSDIGIGRIELNEGSSRGALAERVLRAIKHLPPAERLAKSQALARAVGASLPVDLMMTSQQVCELAAAGMEVGAHTVTHPILRVLPREAAATEIDDSRRVVASITGRPVRAFAYPNGQLNDDYTLRDRDLVSAHGFEVAVSTNGGVATASCDRFQLPRFTPWDRRPERWLARLLMAYRRGA